MAAPNRSSSPRRAPNLLSIRRVLFLSLAFTVVTTSGAVLYGIEDRREATIANNVRTTFRAAQQSAMAEVARLMTPIELAMRQGRTLLAQGVVSPGTYETALERMQPIAAMLPEGSHLWLATPSTAAGLTQRGDPLPSERAPDFARAPWHAAAIERLTERRDRNYGPVTAYTVWPRPGTEAELPALVFALALGETSYTRWVVIDVPTKHFLVGLADLLPTANGYVVVALPDSAMLGLSGYTEPEPTTIAGAAPPPVAMPHDLWAREKERKETARRIAVNEQPWWAAFVEHPLHGGPTLTIGVLSPERDLANTLPAIEIQVVRVMGGMIVVVIALTFLVGSLLRRPIRAVTARMERYDAKDMPYRYWPRTLVAELNRLMAAIDGFQASEVIREAPPEHTARPTPADEEGIPQAQLQALYATRRRLRGYQQRVQALEAALREIEREQPEATGDGGVGMLQFLAEPEERMLLVADAAGKIRWCAVSPELQERYETDFADVPGRDVAAFFAARHAQGRESLFVEARDNGKPTRATFAARFPAGSHLVEAEFVPFQRAGETYAVLIALREAEPLT